MQFPEDPIDGFNRVLGLLLEKSYNKERYQAMIDHLKDNYCTLVIRECLDLEKKMLPKWVVVYHACGSSVEFSRLIFDYVRNKLGKGAGTVFRGTDPFNPPVTDLKSFIERVGFSAEKMQRVDNFQKVKVGDTDIPLGHLMTSWNFGLGNNLEDGTSCTLELFLRASYNSFHSWENLDAFFKARGIRLSKEEMRPFYDGFMNATRNQGFLGSVAIFSVR